MNYLRKKCDVCKSFILSNYPVCKKPIKIENLNSNQFKVTNKDYGICVETVKCRNCDLVQPKYEIDFKQIIKFYSDIKDEEYLKTSIIRGKSNYSQISNILKRYLNKSYNILEIGAGSGGLLYQLIKEYKNSRGIEPSSQFCKFAKTNYNIILKNTGYELLNSAKKYNAVIAMDVIEHVSSPDNLMKTIKNLLKPGGISIIVTPDRNSFLAKITKSKWWHIRPPHLYYFNDRSFEYLANKNDLKIIEKYQFYWTFPVYYLLDSLQKWIFKKTFFNFKFLPFNIKLNTFDSKLYILENTS